MTRDELTLAELDDLPEAADSKAAVVAEGGWFLLDIKKGDSPADIADKMTSELRVRHPPKRPE